MGTIVGSAFFVLFLMSASGVFLKFFFESNHSIKRTVRKSGAESYRAYKKEYNRKMRMKRKLEKQRSARMRDQ